MKYQNLILEQFSKISKVPREKQLSIINSILEQFIDKKKTNVILSASTGAGKSIIGGIVSNCLNRIHENSYKSNISYILMQNNTLVNQYYDTFSNVNNYLNIKGANNYQCKFLNSNAEDCTIKKLVKNNTQNTNYIPQKCKNCQYRMLQSKFFKTGNIITNYNYFFTTSKFPTIFKNTLINVYDQAHLLNDIICNYNKILIDIKSYQKINNIIQKLQLSNQLKVISNNLKNDISNLNQENYAQYLQKFYNLINSITSIIQDREDVFISNNDYESYILFHKYFNYLNYNYITKISDLFQYQYEHIVDVQNLKLEVEPIFIKDMFKHFNKSKYCLFMSATITKQFALETIGLKEQETGFILTDSFFDKENKQVIFINHNSYNYNNLNDNKILNEINSIINQLILQHLNQNGIILVPSFKLQQSITNNLKKCKSHKIFIHEQGNKLHESLENFKLYNKPAILISPTLFQGISLMGQVSQFQIFTKVPYASLSSKRIKYILQNHNDIYKQMALYKIIQGMGRSTRQQNDKSITYCLDKNLYYLFNSNKNLWKHEFVYQSF